MDAAMLLASARCCPINADQYTRVLPVIAVLTRKILFLYSSWYLIKSAGAFLMGTATSGSRLSVGTNQIILGPCVSFLSRLPLSSVLAWGRYRERVLYVHAFQLTSRVRWTSTISYPENSMFLGLSRIHTTLPQYLGLSVISDSASSSTLLSSSGIDDKAPLEQVDWPPFNDMADSRRV